MADNPNTVYWSQLNKTPVESLKDGVIPGGMKVKSICPEYFFRRATEIWGPFGKGWGYEPVEEKYIEGRPHYDNNNNLQCKDVVVVVKVKFWYIHDGEKIVCPPQIGNKQFVYRNQYGYQTDVEAAKKALTDAIKKSMSMLGFGSDVYAGEWDDITEQMLENIKEEIKTEKKEEKAAKDFESFSDAIKKAIEKELPTLTTKRQIETFRTKWTREANKISNPAGYIRRIDEQCDKRINEIIKAKADKSTDEE